MRGLKRLIDLAPFALMLAAFYSEFSNIVMRWWFWLCLAVLATAYVVYKFACLIPAGSEIFLAGDNAHTEGSESEAPPRNSWWNRASMVLDVALLAFGAFVAFGLWLMFVMAASR